MWVISTFIVHASDSSNLEYFDVIYIKFECLLCDSHQIEWYKNLMCILTKWFKSTTEPLIHIKLIHIVIKLGCFTTTYFLPPYKPCSLCPLSTILIGQGRFSILQSQYKSCWYRWECLVLIWINYGSIFDVIKVDMFDVSQRLFFVYKSLLIWISLSERFWHVPSISNLSDWLGTERELKLIFPIVCSGNQTKDSGM